MELKDDSKTTFHDAIGLSTYSNSKAGVLSYVAIFENLWKQSELYEQLQIHDKMQKEFIDIAAHELRTPVQPIISLSEVVLSNIKDPEQAKLLEVVSRNAKRLQKLTEDILDVTRIESKSLNLNKEPFNLTYLISSILDDFRNDIEKKGSNIRLALYEPGDIVVVKADKGRITQVIFNLLSNAVKFTKDDGQISMNIIKRRGVDSREEVMVSIKDTGAGIDSEIVPKLFTKFSTKSEMGGTGLGLFISKSIIEAHSGTIWAENNSNTANIRGATFSFTLPLCL